MKSRTETKIYASGSGALSFTLSKNGKAVGNPSENQVRNVFKREGFADRGWWLLQVNPPYWSAVHPVKRSGLNTLILKGDPGKFDREFRYEFMFPTNDITTAKFRFFYHPVIEGVDPNEEWELQNLSMRSALTYFLRNEKRLNELMEDQS